MGTTVIQCLLGYTEQTCNGSEYKFERDDYGRHVAHVGNTLARSIFLARADVYVEVDEHPNDVKRAHNIPTVETAPKAKPDDKPKPADLSTAEGLATLTKPQLLKHAADLGIEVNARDTKAKLAEVILAGPTKAAEKGTEDAPDGTKPEPDPTAPPADPEPKSEPEPGESPAEEPQDQEKPVEEKQPGDELDGLSKDELVALADKEDIVVNQDDDVPTIIETIRMGRD